MSTPNNEENPIDIQLTVKAAETLQKSAAEDLMVKDIDMDEFIKSLNEEQEEE